MRTVQLSEETYRRLQALARPFEDKDPEEVIQRLLVVAERSGDQQFGDGASQSGADSISETGQALGTQSGSVPHRAELRARYKGREFEARVDNGRVIWNGRSFSSLSAAAVAVIQSTGSRRGTENGWRFWEVRVDGGKWLPGTELQQS